jgi:phospholipase C
VDHRPDYSTEHPSYLPAEGATFINNVISVLRDNPDVWRKTVVILNYDECDGFFDHVAPPSAPPGTPGEYVTVNPLPASAGGIAGPIGLGFRVPMIAISPWSTGGFACGDTFDHTSCIRFMERLTGVLEPNISFWRRSTVGDLVSAFDFRPAPAEFPDLPSPDALPANNPGDANINAEEAECFVAPGGAGRCPRRRTAPRRAQRVRTPGASTQVAGARRRCDGPA